MANVQIWHNPRCGKSRQALALLREHGIEPEIFEYLKTPPTAEDLDTLLGLLGLEPRALLRTKEAPYQELDLGNAGVRRDELLAAMAKYPILIERPIVIRGEHAVIARPPEKALEIVE